MCYFNIFYSGWIYLTKLFCSILYYLKWINSLRQETCFKYFARVKFRELCKTSFLTVRFKVLFYFCNCSEKSIKHFFVKHISSMHHVQHEYILFILINAKIQEALISLVWFYLIIIRKALLCKIMTKQWWHVRDYESVEIFRKRYIEIYSKRYIIEIYRKILARN